LASTAEQDVPVHVTVEPFWQVAVQLARVARSDGSGAVGTATGARLAQAS
jgi:hypothetical protein